MEQIDKLSINLQKGRIGQSRGMETQKLQIICEKDELVNQRGIKTQKLQPKSGAVSKGPKCLE